MRQDVAQNIQRAVRSSTRVSGFTHRFYRYPARFSPEFARVTIQCFTDVGDIVLDPFMGGGTALVEGRALGRPTLGSDISALAHFIARVKTTPFDGDILDELGAWFPEAIDRLNIRSKVTKREQVAAEYSKNVNSSGSWRIRKLVELFHSTCERLPTPSQRDFARCVLLNTAQWALDGRKTIPAVGEFRRRLSFCFESMIHQMREYSETVRAADLLYAFPDSLRTICLNIDARKLHTYSRLASLPKKPKLVLTSPPYCGVHVLYHRWQVEGRKETPLPFWIANRIDGHGPSFYTFANRLAKDQSPYFDGIRESFSSIRQIVANDALVVQLVAFARPRTQLPQYLESMELAGFREVSPNGESYGGSSSRLWREVPNRRWYTTVRDAEPTREVVLFHQPT